MFVVRTNKQTINPVATAQLDSKSKKDQLKFASEITILNFCRNLNMQIADDLNALFYVVDQREVGVDLTTKCKKKICMSYIPFFHSSFLRTLVLYKLFRCLLVEIRCLVLATPIDARTRLRISVKCGTARD
jgi:hypothetical protein